MKKLFSLLLTSALCLSLLTACSGGQGQKQVNLADFAKTLQEQYEFAAYLSEPDLDFEYDKQIIEETMPGLLDLDLEQRVILMTMISLNNGEIVLVQAKSADDAAKAKDSL